MAELHIEGLAIESLKKKAKPEPTGEMCPECGHELVRRK